LAPAVPLFSAVRGRIPVLPSATRAHRGADTGRKAVSRGLTRQARHTPKGASSEASQAQFHPFTDTWTWAAAAETYNQFIDTCQNLAVVEMMEAFHSFLKNSPMMACLAMMAPRLVELRRVLKPTGSLYLHCGPTASHYLKLLLDAMLGRGYKSPQVTQ
jgi:hypothetical protein